MAERIFKTVQFVLTAVGGFLGGFFGGMDGLLYALLAFVIIDYITGVMVAVIQKKLSSEIGFKGLFKKVLIFVLVGVGHILDVYVIGSGSTFRTAIAFFYIANEGISLLENITLIGLPVPPKVKDVLEQIKSKGDNE